MEELRKFWSDPNRINYAKTLPYKFHEYNVSTKKITLLATDSKYNEYSCTFQLDIVLGPASTGHIRPDMQFWDIDKCESWELFVLPDPTFRTFFGLQERYFVTIKSNSVNVQKYKEPNKM